jgi:hypothetical protein
VTLYSNGAGGLRLQPFTGSGNDHAWEPIEYVLRSLAVKLAEALRSVVTDTDPRSHWRRKTAAHAALAKAREHGLLEREDG